MDRRGFLQRIGRGGLGAAVVSVPGGAYAAGSLRSSYQMRGALESRVAASGARGEARVWWSADTEDPVLALTFDDGPTELFTDRVLRVLDRYEVPATFFVIGALVERRPDDVVRIHEAGHELANHTYDHRSAETVGRDDVLRSVELGADAVAAVTGQHPRWLRPVKGHVTGSVLRAAARVGHDVAIWSLSRGRTVADADGAGVRDRLLTKVHPGAIALLHDGVGRSGIDTAGGNGRLVRRRETELAVLPAVIEGWLAAGFRFVTVSALVDDHHDGGRPGPEPEAEQVVDGEADGPLGDPHPA